MNLPGLSMVMLVSGQDCIDDQPTLAYNRIRHETDMTQTQKTDIRGHLNKSCAKETNRSHSDMRNWDARHFAGQHEQSYHFIIQARSAPLRILSANWRDSISSFLRATNLDQAIHFIAPLLGCCLRCLLLHHLWRWGCCLRCLLLSCLGPQHFDRMRRTWCLGLAFIAFFIAFGAATMLSISDVDRNAPIASQPGHRCWDVPRPLLLDLPLHCRAKSLINTCDKAIISHKPHISAIYIYIYIFVLIYVYVFIFCIFIWNWAFIYTCLFICFWFTLKRQEQKKAGYLHDTQSYIIQTIEFNKKKVWHGFMPHWIAIWLSILKFGLGKMHDPPPEHEHKSTSGFRSRWLGKTNRNQRQDSKCRTCPYKLLIVIFINGFPNVALVCIINIKEIPYISFTPNSFSYWLSTLKFRLGGMHDWCTIAACFWRHEFGLIRLT